MTQSSILATLPLFKRVRAHARANDASTAKRAAAILNDERKPAKQAAILYRAMSSMRYPATHSQIAEAAKFKGFQLSVAHRRLPEMEKLNMVKRVGKAICPITNKPATLWLIKKGDQHENSD